ncbi:MAG: cardiolipin synthase [Deltaproteobacteria bacterium]|nr:cardiolipin synthase [Deltaproteobacteria bacterium]
MNLLHWILIFLDVLIVMASAGHALLTKRDPRAALGWIAVCILFPLVGPFLYYLFGINRIRTRAKKLARRSPFRIHVGYDKPEEEALPFPSSKNVPSEFIEIAKISDAVTRRSLVGGNLIEILHNGEQAYPAMLDAIKNAARSLFLATYILETNGAGSRFIEALAAAARRGVDVRVLLDGVGELYSSPRAGRLLKERGVRVARFLPPKLFPPMFNINLRNHRKILVADGSMGFVGGMNIGDRHLGEVSLNPGRVIDLHFRLSGPVVAQVEQVFLEDWSFATGEQSSPTAIGTVRTGSAICRTIVDGPNEDMDKLAAILLGAIASAHRRISIMTPYFLPSREMISALQTAALRGIEVTVILPQKNNLPFVQWATGNVLWDLLQRGVRIYYQPPPFVHTKLFIVDDHYTQIGSANMDSRSLRLNFELAVEVYDKEFSEALATHIEETRKRSREITLEDVYTRPLPVRIRDALAWLCSPYL